MKKLMRFFKEEDGATAVEYGIMVALIAAVIVTAVGLIGTNLNATFEDVAGKVDTTGV
jgi:pilus assembly protein Flp/PilA